jgi:hypothetical protein
VERIPCTHKGTYADDCLCERVRQHKCYIVATCDRDLRRRIRKVGGQGTSAPRGRQRQQGRQGVAGMYVQGLDGEGWAWPAAC